MPVRSATTHQVGLRTITNKETERLTNVVTRVPVTTGATLRRLLQVRAVRHVQNALGNYFNNNLVLFLRHAQLRHGRGHVRLHQEPELCRRRIADRRPHLADLVEQLELYARGSKFMLGTKPGQLLETALAGFKNKRVLLPWPNPTSS